jgi:hypothetical protein
MGGAIHDFETRTFRGALRHIFAEIKEVERNAFDNEITPLERCAYL